MLGLICLGAIHAQSRGVARVDVVVGNDVCLFFRGFEDDCQACVSAGVRITRDGVQAARGICGVANDLQVLYVFQGRPAIVPSVAAFVKGFVIWICSCHVHFLGYPCYVTTPDRVRPDFVLHRRLFSRVDFPAYGVEFRNFRVFFHGFRNLQEVIIRRFFGHGYPLLRFLNVDVSSDYSMDVTVAVLRRCFSNVFLVPGAFPEQHGQVEGVDPVVGSSHDSPRVTCHVITNFFAQLARFVSLFPGGQERVIRVVKEVHGIHVGER